MCLVLAAVILVSARRRNYVTIVMNMVKPRVRDGSEDSDVRWTPTDDNDPSKRRCDGLGDPGLPRGLCDPRHE